MIQKAPVLLGDDDRIFNYLTRKSFEKAGLNCNLMFMTTVEEATSYLDNGQHSFPDLILVDINMPELTGRDFLELYEEKGFGKNSKAIIVLPTSVYRADHDKAVCCPYVHHYIEKPLTAGQAREIAGKFLP